MGSILPAAQGRCRVRALLGIAGSACLLLSAPALPGAKAFQVPVGATRTLDTGLPGPGSSLGWAVDGIAGGNPRVGTVQVRAGALRYRAPASPGSHLLGLTRPSGPVPVFRAAVLVQEACPPAPAARSILNVRDPEFAARGDGDSDDTAAIQKALDAAAGTGATVRVPSGTYLINPVARNGRGLILGSRLTLELAPGAVLKAMPNAAPNYTIVSVSFASDVRIQGGTLEGDRDRHLGGAGEWGMGLSIENSRRVTVTGLSARECWGDGFYIYGSAEVTLCSVEARHNRRNGASIVDCDGLTVRNSVFRDTRGTAPEDGLDIEPNVGQRVRNVRISGCLFADNAASGLESGVPDRNRGRAFVEAVSIQGNVFSGNGRTPADGTRKMAIRLSNSPGYTVTGNVLLDNQGMGIYLRFHADDSLVADNIVAGTRGDGIVQAACRGNRITGNQILDNSGQGVLSTNCVGGSVSGNRLAGNGLAP